MASLRWTTSNQHLNNVLHINVEICDVGQRQIKVVYFNINITNIRERRNKVGIFNVEFHNVDRRRNNVVNMTICKMLKRVKKYF